MNTRNSIVYLVMLFVSLKAYSQNSAQEELNYAKTLDQRASKIVNTLEIADSAKYNRVKSLIVNQYRELNAIHEGKKAKVGTEETAASRLTLLHSEYLKKLSAELTSEQVDAVKNGMTFNVLAVTNKAYQDMIPSLQPDEKTQINTWLVEARELAMDAGSSEEKHQIFGKYKGRINNYLAKRGYDLQKERAAWNARLKR
ncbi:hypothetical protein DYBT9623_01691 [Dyadobacter sp. CECT 9623]|uniref:DUF3826 domain-containing protein n=1 Tax=Dyadobacter linearis TaxID=2823330 RepID=A0ABM8UN85_9BACT|nr:DUF3826 domain-containing protein [Dyadobacter sp. CECT 9623]CAG5068958.1 hypothetical protein DYBT9623_01691 [Dyadobacter sp. CECT 9623]